MYVMSLSNNSGENRGLNNTGIFPTGPPWVIFNVEIEDGDRRLKDTANGVNSKNFVDNVL